MPDEPEPSEYVDEPAASHETPADLLDLFQLIELRDAAS